MGDFFWVLYDGLKPNGNPTSELGFTEKKTRLSLVALMTGPLTLKRRFSKKTLSHQIEVFKSCNFFTTFGTFDRLLNKLFLNKLPPQEETNLSTVLVSPGETPGTKTCHCKS